MNNNGWPKRASLFRFSRPPHPFGQWQDFSRFGDYSYWVHFFYNSLISGIVPHKIPDSK
jgi:hypothetical protein